jgi:hypothetical protein
MQINTEEQLEERLSRPTAADIDAMRALSYPHLNDDIFVNEHLDAWLR